MTRSSLDEAVGIGAYGTSTRSAGKLWTVERAAEHLGISVWKLYRWCRSETVPCPFAVKFGERGWMISRDLLDEYLAGLLEVDR